MDHSGPGKGTGTEKEHASQMKRLALLACITASALAETSGTNVTVEIRTVRIPAADFLEKMPKLLSQGPSVGDLWNSAGSERAELVGLLSASSESANANDGRRSTLEDLWYPAGWGVPLTPIRFVRLPSNIYRALGPTTFELKSVGSALDIEAAPTSDGRVSLNVNYWSTGKPSYRTYTSAFPGGTKMLMVQPEFKTSVVHAKLQLHKGETRLVGTARSSKPGFFDLTLLRLTSHNP